MNARNEKQLIEQARLIKQARAGSADAFCALYDAYRDRLYRYAFYRLGNKTDAEDAVSECVLSAWRQISNLREPDAFPAWIFRILSHCCGRLIDQQVRQRKQISLDGMSNGTCHAGSGIAGNDMTRDGTSSNLQSDTAADMPCSATGGATGFAAAGATGGAAGYATASVTGGAAGYATGDATYKTSGDSTDTWIDLRNALNQLSDEERSIVLLSAVAGLKSHEIASLTGKTAGSVRSSLSRSLKKLRGYLS